MTKITFKNNEDAVNYARGLIRLGLRRVNTETSVTVGFFCFRPESNIITVCVGR